MNELADIGMEICPSCGQLTPTDRACNKCDRHDQGRNHFLELVAIKDRVRYVNDSHSTTWQRTWFALHETTPSIIWIAGGAVDRLPLAPLGALVRERVNAALVIGTDPMPLMRQLHGEVDTALMAQDMTEAVIGASILAQPGDTVLLSPAAPVHAPFKNYEERGEAFRQAVAIL